MILSIEPRSSILGIRQGPLDLSRLLLLTAKTRSARDSRRSTNRLWCKLKPTERPVKLLRVND